MTRPFSFSITTAATAAALIAAHGCADAPTPPRESAQALAAARAAQVMTQVRAARVVADPLIADAGSRLSAAMQDAAVRDRLRALLTQLSAALARGDAPKTQSNITQIRHLIASRSHSADAADFAALGLALDQVEARLADTTTTR